MPRLLDSWDVSRWPWEPGVGLVAALGGGGGTPQAPQDGGGPTREKVERPITVDWWEFVGRHKGTEDKRL